jgi:hypothetical protein
MRKERTSARIPGSYYGKKQFGILEVSGPAGQRQLEIRTHSKRGKVVRTHSIRQQ